MTAAKICGITRSEDALTAARSARMPSASFLRPSPRYIEPDEAASIVGALPPFVAPVGLFVDAHADEVRASSRSHVRLLQFHGSETPEFCNQFARPI